MEDADSLIMYVTKDDIVAALFSFITIRLQGLMLLTPPSSKKVRVLLRMTLLKLSKVFSNLMPLLIVLMLLPSL